MIGALVRYVIGRRLPLFVGTVVVTALVLLSGWLLPFDWFCYLWAAVLSVGVVMATLHDTGDEA